MDSILNSTEENGQVVRCNTGINMNDLLSGRGATFHANFENIRDTDPTDLSYEPSEVFEHTNMACVGIVDEDIYDQSPFENIATMMTDVIPNGKIKKRILRPGVGEPLQKLTEVVINYNSYCEYGDEPIDSTYIRRQPQKFLLGNGEILVGLDIAVETMLVGEKSQFLVHYDFAYGPLGCGKRIPEEATILFEVEVMNALNCVDFVKFNELCAEEQKDFQEILKYAISLCEKANAHIKSSKNYKAAIRDYNRAVSKLEYCQLSDYDEQSEQERLLLRLYTNLTVCHNKLKNPQQVCINCNKIYKMAKGTSMEIHVKVYYNNARAMMLLGDYTGAEKKLRKAASISQHNKDIVRTYLELEKLKGEAKKREANMAQAIFGKANETKITDSFKQLIDQFCVELNGDENSILFSLPSNLTEAELKYVEETAKDHNLIVVKDSKKEPPVYELSKIINDENTEQ